MTPDPKTEALKPLILHLYPLAQTMPLAIYCCVGSSAEWLLDEWARYGGDHGQAIRVHRSQEDAESASTRAPAIERDAEVAGLRGALEKVKWLLDAQRVADLRDLHEDYKMMAGRVMDALSAVRDICQQLATETKAVLDATRAMRLMQDEIAAVTKERDEARAEVAAKQKTIEYACRDWADDDTRVKAIAAKFGIKECHENHDAFKGVIEITEEMATKLTAAESARDALAKRVAELEAQS